jgi:hypothetical protein
MGLLGSTSSSDRKTADVYRQSAQRLVLAVGLLLVAAVVLFAVGRIPDALVACWGSFISAAAVLYLIRAGRRLNRDC